MEPAEISRAVSAAVATAAALGLKVEDATVLHNSNRIAVRLSPCEVLARVAPEGCESSPFEIEVAQRLAETDGPVAELDPRVEPRVYVRDGFAITLWTYFEPIPREVTPREYANALERLHDGMRPVTDIATPHFTDRVNEALRLVDNAELSPELADADRQLLSGALRTVTRTILNSGRPEQLVHGEPHAGNVLMTKRGLLFIDQQTTCRGPIEFDIAHCSPHTPPAGDTASTSWYMSPALPEAVAAEYPAANQDLVRVCWMLVLAMVAAWRWDKEDQFPNGRQMGIDFTNELRAALDRYGLKIEP